MSTEQKGEDSKRNKNSKRKGWWMLKIISFLLVSLLCPALIYAQQLNGKYQSNTPTGEQSRILEFNNGNFIERTQGDLQSKIGKGKFSIIGNLLELNYLNVENQDSSKFDIRVLNSSNHMGIKVKIFDQDSIPLQATIGFCDQNNMPILFFYTDVKGTAETTLFKFDDISYLTIDYVGYHRINVPIKRIERKNVLITAYLKPQIVYYVEPHKETYQFSTHGSYLILKSKSGEFTFKKVD